MRKSSGLKSELRKNFSADPMRKSIAVVFILLAVFAAKSSLDGSSAFCDDQVMATLGGIRDSKDGENSVEIEDLARFAVDEHNKKENALLELARVVKAREQVVAGTMHHLTLEVIDAGNKKLYEAKVWVKPWLNFKELQEFIHVPHFTSSDLGAHKGGPEGGWREVPAHDPEVQIAADHAIKTIQQRSNSLAPYVLQEIVHAKAEVNEGLSKFDMLLHVKRGNSDEKLKVLVHKNDEGSFHLNHMEPHQE